MHECNIALRIHEFLCYRGNRANLKILIIVDFVITYIKVWLSCHRAGKDCACNLLIIRFNSKVNLNSRFKRSIFIFIAFLRTNVPKTEPLGNSHLLLNSNSGALTYKFLIMYSFTNDTVFDSTYFRRRFKKNLKIMRSKIGFFSWHVLKDEVRLDTYLLGLFFVSTISECFLPAASTNFLRLTGLGSRICRMVKTGRQSRIVSKTWKLDTSWGAENGDSINSDNFRTNARAIDPAGRTPV